MKRIFAGLMLGTLLITGCGQADHASLAPESSPLVSKGNVQIRLQGAVFPNGPYPDEAYVPPYSGHVFVNLKNTKAERLTSQDVATLLGSSGVEAQVDSFVLDVSPFFGAPERLDRLSVAGENVNVYVYPSEAEAKNAFELAQNPRASGRASEVSTHFVLWGNLLVTAEWNLLPLIGNCPPPHVRGGTATEPCVNTITLRIVELKLINAGA